MMLRDLRSIANIFLHFHLAGGLPWSVSDRLNVVVVYQVAERPSSKPRSKQLQWVAPADFFKKSVGKYSQIVLNFFRSAYLRFLHQSVTNIFEYSNIRIYWSRIYIRTFVRINVSFTNIFGHSFVSNLFVRIYSDIRW